MTQTSSVISRISNLRRQYVSNLRWPFGAVLELGPFDNPVFSRKIGDEVKYLDWFSKEELAEMHKSNPNRNFDRLPEIDFVVKDHQFAQYIGERFDLISGSHVLEHIPDLISWLNQLEELLADGGQIFLSVPDRRYTFDYFREVSEATAIIRAYEERLTQPSKWQIVESFYYHQKVNLAEIWAGNEPKNFTPRFDLGTALLMAEEKSRSYTDVHCWVFTPSSFKRVIGDLADGGFIRLHVDNIEPTRQGLNEFWVVLCRQ